VLWPERMTHDPVCKTSTPGSSPGGASTFS
jgi:hypothetical protein